VRSVASMPKRHALVIAKIEFGEIPFQMMLAHVMIDAIDAALEDRKIAFDGIRVRIAPDVLICRDDGEMAGELLADFPIDAALVRAKMRISRQRFGNDRLQRRRG